MAHLVPCRGFGCQAHISARSCLIAEAHQMGPALMSALLNNSYC